MKPLRDAKVPDRNEDRALNTSTKIVIAVLLTLSSGSLLYFGGQRILDQQRTSAEITRLRDELYRARVTADRCQRSVKSSEGELRSFDERLQAMRARVDSFEALDPAGVPQELYRPYMTTFDRYNDSVAVWETRERQLRVADTACRSVIIEHNELGDSLQAVLAGLS